jgi:hypothetical protein
MKKVLLAIAASSLIAAYAHAEEAKKPTAEAKAPGSWADKLTLKGDFRYRYESIEKEGSEDRVRNRIRARIGAEAKPTDDLKVGLRLSTSEDGDPVSSNQTLGDGSSRKDVFFDLAYMTWSPVSAKGLSLTGGKMENPFVSTSDLVFDGDLNPEGAAVNYTLGGDGLDLMLNGGYFWTEERSADKDDATMAGGQIAAKMKSGDFHLLAGVGYYAFQNLKGYTILGEKSYGNSTTGGEEDPVTGETAPLLYANEFEILDAVAEVGLNLGVPVAVYGDYAINQDADDDDTGYLVGFRLGKTKEPGSFDFNYNYRELEANAVLGAWSDSDFIGGGTNGKGHKLALGVQLTKVLKGNVTYFMDEIGLTGPSKDYDRLQVDVSAKF